jgi:membrane-bound lytic murein transglycosylase D
MQILTTISKYLLLAILSVSLLLAWDNSNIEITGSNFTEADDISYFTPANSIWSSMSSEFKLDHRVQSSQVQAEISKLLADQQKLYSILQAATPYIYFIYQQTQVHGLPAELALIPIIESEFNPNDHSNKGATGLWQLMAQTARELGVKQHSGYDGRRDVIASTEAALSYFDDLGNNFKGDWYLALAAYNCGQGRVQSAVRRTGSHNFWNLRLPQETKYYVPKLLAVAEIIENPEKYGVQLPPIDNEPYFTELNIKKPVNMERVAKVSGINIKTLKKLNPDYNHGIIPKKGKYKLLVPVNKAPAVKASLSA